MNNEEDSTSSHNSLIEEKSFIIETDKKNKMDLYLRIYNNEEFAISIYTRNEYPKRKFELKCDLEEIQKNRFFRIFINIDEIMKELEDKIKKSTFIEENDLINVEIPIGLIIIENINLNIKLVEKTTKEINEELKQKIQKQEKEIKNLKNQINQLNNNNINLNNQLNEKDEIIKKLREEITQLKKTNEQIKNEKASNKNKLKIKL
jgi:predicted  nucleic acid-binding Zn-ribbon protein